MTTKQRTGVPQPGDVFGELTVLRQGPSNENGTSVVCRCSCGKEVVKRTKQIKQGVGLSCGCKTVKGAPASKTDAQRLWVTFQHKHRVTGHAIGITEKQFTHLISQPCHYCGANPRSQVIAGAGANKRTHATGQGIDRVDSSKGYVPGNCVPCCTTCNSMKSDLPVDTFLDQVKAIYHKLFG